MKFGKLNGLVVAALVASACTSGERPLVLLDGSPDAARAAVAARAEAFAKRGRAVQVLRVDPAHAVELAARGEGEVAVVAEGTPLGDFVTSSRGRDAGALRAEGASLRVLEVDGHLHPKVDGGGAHALATFLATP